jgi:hypothetical protein
MSDSQYLDDDIIIGINDTEKKSFETINMSELVKRTFTPMEYRFQHYFNNEDEMNQFNILQQDENFSFYAIGNRTPLFDRNNSIVYSDIEEKINQKHLIHISKGDEYNDLITEIILDDEELYIKIIPSMKLIRIVTVRLEQHRINRI